MANNLKLNIKNAQLAEALKLNIPKKAPVGKKAKATPTEEPVLAPVEEQAPSEPASKKEKVAKKVETPEPVEPAPSIVQETPSEPAPVEKEVAEAPPQKKILPGFVKRSPDFSERPYQRRDTDSTAPQRPAYSPRPSQDRPYDSTRPSYPPRQDRPYDSNRPSYPPRQDRPYDGNRPSYPPRQDRPYDSNRPSYPPRQDRPAFENRPITPRPPVSDRPVGSTSTGAAYPVGPNYPVKRTGPPPASRPPFRREGSGDFRPDSRNKPLMPIKEPSLKESPQQHQVYKKAGTTGDFSKKSALSKDVKPTKKLEDNKSFDSRDRQGLRTSDDERWRKRKPIKSKQQLAEEVIRPKQLKVRLPITIKDLSAEMKLKASQLIAKLFMQGVVVTLNDFLDDETTIQLLGHEFECAITIDTTEEERIRITDKTIKQEIQETAPELLVLRPPVVTFMGHVDHGKTSLIDTIRKSNVAASEAGAITQHIGAFKCHTQVGEITILDTPGHEAFSAMRERGADVTDIVVLVVAGDEGIKTQTIEAIQQAQKASVPMIVALNKSDKPNFNAENVYRQLADQNLLPEAWGGTVITVNCSATSGDGIKELLEMLALQAEILELRANPAGRARGSVIESEMHKGLGTVATLLVQNGTLNIGDALVFDQFYARVKTMHDEHGKELMHAGPSSPVKITGLSGFPEAGSEFIVVKDEKEARDISEKRNEGQKLHILQQSKKTSLENLLQNKADSAGKKTLNLILKADVQGSLEALKTSLRKIPSTKIDLNFISEGVGEISESDILFAATSKATILGFHTKIESHAETLIKQNKITIRLHDIIYHAVDDVKKIMLSCLDKIPQENEMGEAAVKAVFKSSQLGNIAGCQVSDGLIKRNHHARLVRDKEVIWKGPIASLKRMKEDVKEVQKGYECGILLQGFTDFKEGDIIQAYDITYLQQEL